MGPGYTSTPPLPSMSPPLCWVTQDIMAGIWTEENLEHSACRICSNSMDLLLGTQWLFGNWFLLVEAPHIWCQGNLDSLSPMISGLKWCSKSGEQQKYTWHPETVLDYLYFQSSWQNQAVYPMCCMWQYLVLALPPHMPCFLGNSSAIFSSEQGIHITWVFEQICCFPSVAQSCPTLCDPMDCSTPGFPVHHHLPELAQTHVHWVSDAIQPSHPLPSPSPPAFNQSFPVSGSFPVNQFFVSGGHSIGASASALAFPMNIQGWLPFGLTGLTILPVMNIKMWNTFQLFAGGELCAFLTGMC